MLGFAAIVIILALVVQRYTLRKGFDGITYDIRAAVTTVEPEQPFELVTVLKNNTLRFVPFLGMREALPNNMAILTSGIEPQATPDRSGYEMASNIYLMPKQRLERRVSVSLSKRGCYFLRGATLQIGDFLGLYESVQMFKRLDEIVVIPRAHPAEQIISTLGGFLGDVSVRRFIMEDPVLTLGFREYTMHEPMKMISWMQTARKGELMVKTLDYTLEPTVTVLLNIESSITLGRLLPYIEVCYSLARTVCEFLEKSRIKYDFVTNASAAGAISLWSEIGEGLGQRHLTTILEGLGRATYSASGSFAALLGSAAGNVRQGCSYIVVTPLVSDSGNDGIARLRELCGGQVCVISAEEAM